MRKILLGTTAVVGAALLAPSAMAQQAPTVRVGGFFLFEAYGISDSADKRTIPGAGVNNPGVPGAAAGGTNTGRIFSKRAHNFSQESEVDIFVDGKTANGLSYGGVIEFQIDALQQQATGAGAGAATVRLGNGTGVNTDEAYGYISGSFGTFRFGDEDSAGSLMQVRRPGIIGTNSDTFWDEQLTGGQASRFTGINDGSDTTKIIYMTPQFAGFDFGASFAPSATEGEMYTASATVLNSGARDRSTIQDEVSWVARYRASIAGIGLAASYAGQTAKPSQLGNTVAFQAVTANSVGLVATAYGFSVGGEYTWGQYTGVSVGRAALGTGRRMSSHYVVGASYDIPATPIQLGAWYGMATQDINGANQVVGGVANGARVVGAPEYRQNVWSVGANYTLAPGMIGYVSFTRMIEKNNADVTRGGFTSATRPNGIGRDANIVMTGFNLAF